MLAEIEAELELLVPPQVTNLVRRSLATAFDAADIIAEARAVNKFVDPGPQEVKVATGW